MPPFEHKVVCTNASVQDTRALEALLNDGWRILTATAVHTAVGHGHGYVQYVLQRVAAV